MLRPLVGGERLLDARGRTLQELIGGIDAKHAGFAAQLLDSHGQLKSYVNVYVNDDDIRYLAGLGTPVSEGDVVSILPAVAGGTGLV